jgi:hypothetical protein
MFWSLQKLRQVRKPARAFQLAFRRCGVPENRFNRLTLSVSYRAGLIENAY